MGWFDTIRKVIGGAISPSPITAGLDAIGAVGNAVADGETLANNKQLLNAGTAEGEMQDDAQTEKRVDAAAGAPADKQLQSDVEANRFRD